MSCPLSPLASLQCVLTLLQSVIFLFPSQVSMGNNRIYLQSYNYDVEVDWDAAGYDEPKASSSSKRSKSKAG